MGNLREATNSQNIANSKLFSSNTSGHKGVSYSKSKEKWRAYVCKDGATIWLGYYNSKEAAHRAYSDKATELFGEFANTGAVNG